MVLPLAETVAAGRRHPLKPGGAPATNDDTHLIASGGVSGAEDLRKLSKMPRLHGAIIGKALYDGRITGNLRKLIS